MTFKKGEVVEVIEAEDGWRIAVGERYILTRDEGGGWVYIDDPAYQSYEAKRFKLVSEGPVRTVTRQEIIPGTYDGVEVGSEVTGHPQREVLVRIAPDHGPMVCMDHTALTNAAAVLTALAGALRDDR